MLAFAFAAALVAGVLSGLAPALRASRASVVEALGGTTPVVGRTLGHRRLASVFQAVQVGLTVVLLAGTGLMVNSFVRMMRSDPGFDVEKLVYFELSLSPKAYPGKAEQDAFFDQLVEGARVLPGVRAAAVGTPPPVGSGGTFVPEGGETASERPPLLTLHYVESGYFGVTGILLKAGRGFGPEDSPAGPPVAVIDEAAARRFWPGQGALGRRFRYSPYVPWITVVGVAGHVKTQDFASDAGSAAAYLPLTQEKSAPYRCLLVRTAGNPSPVLASVRAQIRALDPRQAVTRAGAVADLYDEPLVAPRFVLVLMSLFAVLALVTAAVGLYALLSYSVNQRRQEIGIRMALGADPAQVRRLVVRDALAPVAAGLASGIIGALWLTRFIGSLLYQVRPHDPATYAAVVLVLLGVAAIAAFIPARRATRVAPLEALRVP
ncbi:MAG: hypothetical protein DMG07_26550 [Acidobacteria bacterium]|nr:MAG: hypothetical protein DMG07_26550 [Acidobacteriota bacterium]